MQLAPFIDHTVLKSTVTTAEIIQCCEEAVNYGFAAVCIPPYFVQTARKHTDGSGVKTATVIGFPFGYSNPAAKLAEADRALSEGAHELDLVMNIAAFRAGDMDTLGLETEGILSLQPGVVLKVIIESGALTDDEIIRCCTFYAQYPVAFLKTSTGYAEKGASVEAIRLMRAHLPERIALKASGGIRTAAFARALVEAGATRLGCSASIAIVKDDAAGAQAGY